jgi:tRNA(Ile)-lysidine synthase
MSPINKLEPLEKAVLGHVDRLGMFARARRAVVAVSGGPDSMALLHVLARLHRLDRGPALIVAHLDHRLRGAESTADSEFVAKTARRMGLESVVESMEVREVAQATGRNLEAVARDVRYDFLGRTAVRMDAPVVATAHTASDQAETVLMRLARGAGPDGLAGIAPFRWLDGQAARLVRPLLACTRREVIDYCQSRGIEYRQDSSNFDPTFARAYTRHQILPRVEEHWPGATTNLTRTAALAADDRDYFRRTVAAWFERYCVTNQAQVELPIDALRDLHPALRRRILREAVRRAHGDLRRLTSDHVESLDRLLEPGRSGRCAALPLGRHAVRHARHLVIEVVDQESG